jgi:hypothetical protein
MGRFFFAGTHSIKCVLIFLLLNLESMIEHINFLSKY